MGVNLEKHKDSLLAAWKDVVDDKTTINWALFGYEGNTTTLKVISKGDEGLEEMIEEFSSGKVMYAFCKVMDPNTSLPKFVFINWQGEAAPLEIKGKCANHVTDVVRFFKGAHVTINARTEDDVDVDLIINKVAKSTVSAYNFKDRSAPEVESSKPVGSVYKRIIPTAEINAMERDKFWEKEEAEEKRRLEEERKKSEEIKQKLEEERKQREIQEAKAREEREKQRMKSINQLREAEKLNSKSSSESDQARWEKQLLEDRQAEEERRQRRDSLCKERKEEARALISQRTINARAIFEQNTAAGQMSSKRPSFSHQSSEQNSYTNSTPTNSVNDHNDLATSTTQMPLPKPDVIPSNPPEATSPSPEPDVATSYQQPSAVASPYQNNYVPDTAMQRAVANEDDVRLQLTNEVWEDNSALNAISQEAQLAQHEYNAAYDALYNDTQVIGQCLRARALYDYQAADDTEISFDPDDIITHIEQIDEGWWQGVGPDGSFGLFPANYVELIE